MYIVYTKARNMTFRIRWYKATFRQNRRDRSFSLLSFAKSLIFYLISTAPVQLAGHGYHDHINQTMNIGRFCWERGEILLAWPLYIIVFTDYKFHFLPPTHCVPFDSISLPEIFFPIWENLRCHLDDPISLFEGNSKIYDLLIFWRLRKKLSAGIKFPRVKGDSVI